MPDNRAFLGEVDPDVGARLWFLDGTGVREPVEHVVSRSPGGLAWGYVGNGPADAALSILTAATGDAQLAERRHEQFMRDVLAKLQVNERFVLPAAQVEGWLAAQGERIAGRDRPGVSDAAGAMPEGPERQAAALAAQARALDERARRLFEREVRVDAMATVVGLGSPVERATSLPVEPVRHQLEALVVDTGDDVAEVARARGIEPRWAAAVVAGTATEVDLGHVPQVCEGLGCTPYDLWGSAGARSIAHAYGPDAWPVDTEPLTAVDGEEPFLATPSDDWPRAGLLRLWRVEPEALEATPGLPQWLAAQPDVADRLSLQGRWFTAEEADVDYYVTQVLGDGGVPRTYYLDMPAAEAQPYRASADPVAQRFSRSPLSEYLLPAALAAEKVPVLAEAPSAEVAFEPSALTLVERPAPELVRELGPEMAL